MELDIEDLNPRVCVAIRKAWNTDFAQATFTSYHASENGHVANSNGLPMRATPTSSSVARPTPHNVHNFQPQTPSQNLQNFDYGNSHTPINFQQAHSFETYATPSETPSNVSDSVSILQRQLGRRQQHRGARAAHVGNISLQGYEAPTNCPAASSNQNNNNQTRRASPNPAFHDQRPGFGLPQKPSTPNSYSTPQSHLKPPNFVPSHHNQDRADEFDNVFAPPPQASISYAQNSNSHHEAAWGAEQNVQRQLGNVKRDLNNDWAGDSLGDALGPRQPAQNRYGNPGSTEENTSHAMMLVTDDAASISKQNHVVGWDGSSLADALGEKQPTRNRYFDPANVEEDNSGGVLPARQGVASGWDGISLGDALGKKQPTRNRYSDPANVEEDISGGVVAARQGVASGWDGVSLGDTLGKKQPARNRYADPANIEDDNFRGVVAARQGAASDWDGASLDDVMGSRPQAKNRYGDKMSDDVHGSANVVQQVPLEQAENGWGGGLPADPSGHISSTSYPQHGSAPVAPDPWAGVSLGDALGSAPKATKPTAPPEPRPTKKRGAGGSSVSAQPIGQGKTPTEIATWLRTLPESHVPEQAREGIISIVEENDMHGNAFTQYVETVPAEVCGPKHKMKLKAAWKNVLAEYEAQAICRQNLDYLASHGGGGVEVKV